MRCIQYPYTCISTAKKKKMNKTTEKKRKQYSSKEGKMPLRWKLNPICISSTFMPVLVKLATTDITKPTFI